MTTCIDDARLWGLEPGSNVIIGANSLVKKRIPND